MINWFSKRSATRQSFGGLVTDIHSHLLPGLDDGVGSLEESEAVVRILEGLGYRRLITTPHVMSDLYRNTAEMILEAHQLLLGHLARQNVKVTVEAAAEYYLDETLTEAIQTSKPLLTFGRRYLLFETNFMTEPLMLKEFIFASKTKGYNPVLAHPERYLYLQQDPRKLQDLIDRGVLFQANVGSFGGQYGPAARQTAALLVKKGWIHFLGTDCHNLHQANLLQSFIKDRHLQKALLLPTLNASL